MPDNTTEITAEEIRRFIKWLGVPSAQKETQMPRSLIVDAPTLVYDRFNSNGTEKVWDEEYGNACHTGDETLASFFSPADKYFIAENYDELNQKVDRGEIEDISSSFGRFPAFALPGSIWDLFYAYGSNHGKVFPTFNAIKYKEVDTEEFAIFVSKIFHEFNMGERRCRYFFFPEISQSARRNLNIYPYDYTGETARCYNCDKLVKLRHTSMEALCSNCIRYKATCNCGKDFFQILSGKFKGVSVPSVGWFCSHRCVDNFTFRCDFHGATKKRDRGDGCSACESGKRKRQQDKYYEVFSSYSFRPTPIFHAVNKYTFNKNQFITGAFDFIVGLEIEVNIMLPEMTALRIESENDFARYFSKRDPHKILYYKSDGSIYPQSGRGMGIECVSHPTGMRWMKDNPDWIKPFEEMWKAGVLGYTGSNCGMHIHVHKKCISNLSLLKIATFFSKNKRFILKYTDRAANALDSWARTEAPRSGFVRIIRNGSDNRYSAINVGEYTNEFRIFRSTLNPSGIMKNIEFVKALRDHSLEVKEITPESFYGFVSKNRKEFPNAMRKMNRITAYGEDFNFVISRRRSAQ